MKRNILLFLLFSLFGCVVWAQSKLTGFSYWFNNEYQKAQMVAFVPAKQHMIDTNIDASELSDGLNVLNIRYKDENEVYSSTVSKVFVKVPQHTTVGKKLVGYEYWFNNDYGNVNVVEILPAQQQVLMTDLNVMTLFEGLNLLNIRYKDESGFSSLTLTKMFFKIPQQIADDNKLVEYEYWFNNDYSQAKVTKISETVEHLLVTDLDASLLPEGINTLNFRYKDENGNYSVTIGNEFIKQGGNVGLIENTLNSSVKLYPNPSNGCFTVYLGNNFSKIEYSISDNKGTILQKEKMVNVQEFPVKLNAKEGVYFLWISAENTTRVFKVLVE